jgi:hypothetical protein
MVPSSPNRLTLMMEVICSSETFDLTRATRRHIPEAGILHSHCRESLKSYIALAGWAMQRRLNVSSVRYELGFCIPEDDILYCTLSPTVFIVTAVKTSNFNKALTGWTLYCHCRENLNVA